MRGRLELWPIIDPCFVCELLQSCLLLGTPVLDAMRVVVVFVVPYGRLFDQCFEPNIITIAECGRMRMLVVHLEM